MRRDPTRSRSEHIAPRGAAYRTPSGVYRTAKRYIARSKTAVPAAGKHHFAKQNITCGSQNRKQKGEAFPAPPFLYWKLYFLYSSSSLALTRRIFLASRAVSFRS